MFANAKRKIAAGYRVVNTIGKVAAWHWLIQLANWQPDEHDNMSRWPSDLAHWPPDGHVQTGGSMWKLKAWQINKWQLGWQASSLCKYHSKLQHTTNTLIYAFKRSISTSITTSLPNNRHDQQCHDGCNKAVTTGVNISAFVLQCCWVNDIG